MNDTEKRQIVNKHNQLRSDPKTTQTARAMCKVVGPKYFFLLYSQHQRCPTGKTLTSNWSVNGSIMVIHHEILVVISAQTLTIYSHRQSAVSDVPRGWK